MTPDDPQQNSADPHSMTVVGIGASAGGLGALKAFFARAPQKTGMAFVVVVHLSPEHKSHLAELLQPHCPIPVQQVNENVPLKPDHVYIIPPGANLDAIDTHLRLSELEPRRAERAPIDHFFRTLADTHDGHAVGVVLTGTGSDGTLGLRRLKERGGLTIAQNPDEAEYDGMPRSAIASGMVDLALPIGNIVPRIIEFDRTQPKLAIPADGEEFGQFSADLHNLLAATDIATLFLDRDLRIVRYTPRVGELFNIRVTDRGRPLSDLTHRLGYDNLHIDAQRVLDRLVTVEREIHSENDQWFLTRILPYRTGDDRIEGVVITMIDITEQKQSEKRFRTLFESIDEGFCIIEVLFDENDQPRDYRFVEVNPVFTEQSGIEDPIGRTMREICPEHEAHWFETYGRVATTGRPERFRNDAAELGRHFDVYAFRVGRPEQRRVAVLFRNISEQKAAEDQLREARDELERRVAERTAELNRLTERLRAMANELADTEQRERKRLAKVLHDDMQQHLVAARLQLDHARHKIENPKVLDGINRAFDSLSDAAELSRTLTRQLWLPVLYESGLVPALRWLVNDVAQRYDFELHVDAPETNVPLDDRIKTTLFEAIRELVFNVVKHAGVSEATVRVDRDADRLNVIVEDHGAGFDREAIEAKRDRGDGGMGLFSLGERLRAIGGSMSLESIPGDGTRVVLETPIAR